MPDFSSISPILLTGGTTGAGRRLAPKLLACGASVRCLAHTPSKRALLPEHPRLEVLFGSADDPDSLREALRGVRTVAHLAGHRFTPLLVRTMGEEERDLRLLVVSSTRLLSRYPTPVRESVRAAEEAVEAAPPSISWTILRPSMIFGGPEDRNMERIAQMLARRRFFPLFGSGRNLVQPLFVRDLVRAHIACLERPETGRRSYTLAGPEAVTFRTLVRAVARASGSKPPLFVPLPRTPCLLAARLLCKIWPRSPLNPEVVQRFGEDKRFDISPARRDLAFDPTPLEKALDLKFRREA